MDAFQRRLAEQIREMAAARKVPLTHLPDLAGVSRSHFWDVLAGRKSPTVEWLAQVAEALEVDVGDLFHRAQTSGRTRPQRSHSGLIPLYSLRVAAGLLGPAQDVQPYGWIQPRLRARRGERVFAAQVVGKSMEPLIPDGALCLFELFKGGNVERRIVLVEHRELNDVETGGSYTVKRFVTHARRGNRRTQIRLESLNPKFRPMVLRERPGSDVRIIAEFVEVLGPP